MADSNRTAYSGPTLSGPGIITSTSYITKPDELSDELFNKWYNEVHIPDVTATGAVRAACRFRNADPDAPVPYLAVYMVPDLAAIQSEKFKSIPMTNKMLPGGASIHNFVLFDTRFYSLIQEFEKEKQEESGFFPSVLLAGMEPSETGADDLDAWYRQEHLEQMSKEPGWRRAKRYQLLFQVKNADNPSATEDAPTWLALYEFDENAKLGKEVKPLQPITEWTKRCLADAKKLEAGIYHKIKPSN